jgi:hypothetical protein
MVLGTGCPKASLFTIQTKREIEIKRFGSVFLNIFLTKFSTSIYLNLKIRFKTHFFPKGFNFLSFNNNVRAVLTHLYLSKRHTCELSKRHTCELSKRHTCELSKRHTCEIPHDVAHVKAYQTCPNFQNVTFVRDSKTSLMWKLSTRHTCQNFKTSQMWKLLKRHTWEIFLNVTHVEFFKASQTSHMWNIY